MAHSEATHHSEDMVLTMRTRRTGCGLRWSLVVALVALVVWPVVDAAPTVQRTKQQPKNFGQGDALEFLKKYGYLSKGGINAKGTTGALLAEDTFTDAIKAYQAFSGLPVTGNLDAATVQLMRTPRCGVKDIDPAETAKGRHKRYVLEGSKWWKQALTYRVSQPLSAAYTAPSSGGLGSWLGSWLGLGGGGGGAKKVVGGGGGKKLEAAAAEAAVERALGVWAERSGLTFARAPAPAKGRAAAAPADLDVRFERGAHGHCDDFDGRGGTLAHAYYPRFGGDAHFDADEHWTLGEYRGTNFFQVAVHEFGHSLGLRHSDDPDAVMAPVYRGYDPYFELHQDDIDAIQDLYGAPSHSQIQMADQQQQQQQQQQQEDDEEEQGKEDEDKETDQGKRSGEEDGGNKGQEDKGEDGNENENEDGKEDRNEGSEEESKETEEEDEDDDDDDDDDDEDGKDGGKEPETSTNELCEDPSVDAMFNTPDGDIYVLKGARYYLLGAAGGVAPGYPRPLAERWPGLPAGVDAAFATAAGATYFFKGALYWRYDDAGPSPSLHAGYPRRVALGMPEAPDAALLRPADGRLYLFKGAEVWHYDSSRKSYISRPLAQWKGVPSGLDAAFFHGGYTYFFKDGLYYRFDDVAFKVDDGSPPFPRSSAAWWFGCKHTTQAHELTDK